MAPLSDIQLLDLLNKFQGGKCTDEELQKLQQWFDETNEEDKKWQIPEEAKAVFTAEMYTGFQLKMAAHQRTAKVIRLRKAIAIAASVIIVALGGYALYNVTQKNVSAPVQEQVATDIAPGRNGAVLTLADGSTVELDSAETGIIATQNGVQVVNNNGQLSYENQRNTDKNVAYNTLTTPKARQYNLVLPDGSKVWLNAATTLQFPVAFSATERRVVLTGEAYFEVAHNAQKPFYVVAGGQQVKVLGTHFNINSYADEQRVSTTLLQGSVEVEAESEKTVLQPGQEAVLHNHSLIKQQANIDKAIAWKDGLLDMDGQTLEEIMRQISRWYDVEIIYTGKMPNVTLRGQMDRALMLSDIIKGLEQLHVHCHLEGKRLIVKP